MSDTPDDIRIECADALEFLRALPDESVDIIWTDPPYGNNNNNGDLIHNWEKALGHAKDGEEAEARPILNDDPENWERVVTGMLDQAARVLRRDSCCCCCCGGGGPKVLFARVADWVDRRLQFDQAVVWDKGGLGMGWKYRRNYEFVMVAHRKGGKLKWESPWNDWRTANVVKIPKIIPSADEHPTPKPIDLVTHFLRLHGKPGDVVCDPFMGGGTTAVAAMRLGMKFVGCELDPHWHEYSLRRIERERGRVINSSGEVVEELPLLFEGAQ